MEEEKEGKGKEEPQVEESLLEEIKKTLQFPTEELDRLTRSVDDARKDVEEFLTFLKERQEKPEPEERWVREVKEKEIEGEEERETEEFRAEEAEKEEIELPPWAEAIRDRVEEEPTKLTDLTPEPPRGFPLDKEEEEEEAFEPSDLAASGEVTPSASTTEDHFPWRVDSGVGLPEKPGRQQPLPFASELEEERMALMGEEKERQRSKTSAGMKKAEAFVEREEEGEEEEEKEKDEEKEDLEPASAAWEERVPSRSFLSWIKAKIFDLIFVALLWFIAFVLAARMMDLTVFSLVAASLPQAGSLFLILLIGYFSLFRFFIGETLGDRLFSATD